MVELKGKCNYCKYAPLCQIKATGNLLATRLTQENIYGNIWVTCSLFEKALDKSLPAWDVLIKPYTENLIDIRHCKKECKFAPMCSNQLTSNVRVIHTFLSQANSEYDNFYFSCPCLAKTEARLEREKEIEDRDT